MKLTAIEFRVTEDHSVEYKEGEVFTFLLGTDDEWYKLAPGKSIKVSEEDLQVLSSNEDSLLERVE